MMLDEFDNSYEAVINPCNLIDKVENMPDIAIACFSDVLFNKIVEGGKCIEIAKLHNTNGYKSVYEIEYKGCHFALFMIGVGAPAAAADLEDIHQMGANKFIVFGNCGVLDTTIEDCSIIIPNKALRDEGTSYHYMASSRSVDMNTKYKDLFKEILNDMEYSYVEGTTWTTDAFYRETKDKVKKRKEEGAITVEMEASALQAVANFRNMDLFMFFYAADKLDGDNWDKRSLSGEVKLDEKSQIAYLALELGYKISNEN